MAQWRHWRQLYSQYCFCSKKKKLYLGRDLKIFKPNGMNRIIIALFMAVMLSPSIVDARNERCADDRRDCNEHRVKRGQRHRSPYCISGQDVFFEGKLIKDANASSFNILRGGYAKDTWNVYYRGSVIKEAASSSFKVLGSGYAKDTWNVYYKGRKINGAAAGSFTVLGDGYAKDTWTVYYDGSKLQDAAAGSFKVMRDGYARDTWNTYYRGQRIDR